MTDLHRRVHTIELSSDEQVALIQYAIERLVKDEIERRKTPALFQPKQQFNNIVAQPAVHPTYTPT